MFCMSKIEEQNCSNQQHRQRADPAPLAPKQAEFVELLGQLLAELWQKEMAGIRRFGNHVAAQPAVRDVASGTSNSEKIVRNSLTLRAAPQRRHAAARKTPKTRKARERQ